MMKGVDKIRYTQKIQHLVFSAKNIKILENSVELFLSLKSNNNDLVEKILKVPISCI